MSGCLCCHSHSLTVPASLGSALASQRTCHGLSIQHSWERYDLPSASGRRQTNPSFGCGFGGGQVSYLGEPLWLSLTSGQSGEVHVSLPSQVPLACCLALPLLWMLFVVWGFAFFKADADRSFCCETVATSGKYRAGFYSKMPCGWPEETVHLCVLLRSP